LGLEVLAEVITTSKGVQTNLDARADELRARKAPAPEVKPAVPPAIP
jgi:hypothetical protein